MATLSVNVSCHRKLFHTSRSRRRAKRGYQQIACRLPLACSQNKNMAEGISFPYLLSPCFVTFFLFRVQNHENKHRRRFSKLNIDTSPTVVTTNCFHDIICSFITSPLPSFLPYRSFRLKILLLRQEPPVLVSSFMPQWIRHNVCTIIFSISSFEVCDFAYNTKPKARAFRNSVLAWIGEINNVHKNS
jgi:hypothetical protein